MYSIQSNQPGNDSIIFCHAVYNVTCVNWYTMWHVSTSIQCDTCQQVYNVTRVNRYTMWHYQLVYNVTRASRYTTWHVSTGIQCDMSTSIQCDMCPQVYNVIHISLYTMWHMYQLKTLHTSTGIQCDVSTGIQCDDYQQKSTFIIHNPHHNEWMDIMKWMDTQGLSKFLLYIKNSIGNSEHFHMQSIEYILVLQYVQYTHSFNTTGIKRKYQGTRFIYSI